MRRQEQARGAARRDLGLEAVEQVYRDMQIDEAWSVREGRGFTWWGAWVRQHVWAGPAVRSAGETLWHVRSATPLYRDVPDEPATYAFIGELNAPPGTSAFVFDPAAGTVSLRCGALVYDGIASWIGRYLSTAVALEASIAWRFAHRLAGGRRLDEVPHPTSGPRRDPDDMLNLVDTFPAAPSPFHRAVLRRAAGLLGTEGHAAAFGEEEGELIVLVPLGDEGAAGWTLGTDEHPMLGPGAMVRLVVPQPGGPRRLAWLANALNLAEAADFAGERRPQPFGAWTAGATGLVHSAFFPAALLGNLDGEAALVAIRNLLAWGSARAAFAGARLPWLGAQAAARYPDDEAPADDGAGEENPDEPAGEGVTGHEAPAGDEAPADEAGGDEPVHRRSFGPASREPRPRDPAAPAGRMARTLVVDTSDPAAFHEVDDAVAAAEDGDQVVVRPGTYRKPVVVDRAVTIVGEGDGDPEAVLLEPVGGEALGVAASGAVVRGLTVRPARAGNDGADYSALAVHDAAVLVERCRLTSHLGATAWIGGPAAHAVLRDCVLSGGAQNAAWVVEEARAELEHCRVDGHRWHVAVGGAHASLVVRDCEVVDNLDAGIVSTGRALLVVERTTVSRNAGVGVVLGEPSPASRVEGCTIEDNSEFGVLVGAGRGAAVLRNRIAGNAVGIVVVEGATPRIEGNELVDNGTGIGVRGEGSNPAVVANTITGGRGSGVVIDEAAAGRYEGNTVSGTGGAGVWVDDHGTAPRFTGNHVSASAFAGVLVTDGAGGEFRSNDLRGNAAGSWKLDAPGELRRDGNLEDAGPPSLVSPPVPPADPPRGGRLVH